MGLARPWLGLHEEVKGAASRAILHVSRDGSTDLAHCLPVGKVESDISRKKFPTEVVGFDEVNLLTCARTLDYPGDDDLSSLLKALAHTLPVIHVTCGFLWRLRPTAHADVLLTQWFTAVHFSKLL